ncbi:hypothetical protein JCM10207_006495 [Rhodosporidiobolus poonsookiae]
MSDDGTFKPCKNCFEGFRLDGTPKGAMETIGGLDCYVSKGNGTHSEQAIVLGSDIFGLGIANPKILADWFSARTGLDTFVPDMFQGDYIDTANLKPQLDILDKQFKTMGLFSRMWAYLNVLYGMAFKVGPAYLARHKKPDVVLLVDKVCVALKQEKGYKKLGWVGYCFGADIGIHLATENGPIDVLVAVHPGGLPIEDFEKIRRPLAMICADEDMFFDKLKPKVLPVLDTLQKTHSVPVVVHDSHEGTTHGFGCRPNLADPKVKVAFEQALVETKEWFDEHL